MQFVRNLRRAPLGRLAAAGSAAAAAATLSSHADAEPLNLTKRGSVMVAPSDSITEVVIQARPVSQHIEEQQRELADSYADFSGDCSYEKALRALRSAFKLPSAELSRLSMHFRREAIKGLEGAPSSMQMIPTFVTKRVTGDEKGDFYALDLGGTNFRVLRLSLEGGGKVGAVKQAKFTISEATKTSDAAGLFGFLADSIATFLAKECGGNPSGDLGFTFSFPVTQTAINAGTLVMWNKGFTAAGVVGHDVVDLLQTQLSSRGINLKVKALANDTVGTMEAAAYAYPDTTMGVILGTGTNAAYIEKGSKLGKWKGPPCDEMVINTEWGNLDMTSVMNAQIRRRNSAAQFGAIRTDGTAPPRRTRQVMNATDHFIDGASTNPGKQTFEKMVSGMYLGEICRVAVLSPEVLSGFSAGCQAELRAAFAGTGALKSALMSAIEADDTAELSKAGAALAKAGVSSTTVRDRVLLREAAVNISSRAARLSAMGVASLLQLQEWDGAAGQPATVAVDGSVFELYPRFKERMEGGIAELLGVEAAKSVKLVLAKDGSGIGASIIAAVAE